MNARRKGATLLEVIVASAILVGVLGMAYLLLQTSTNEYANQSVHLALDQRARDVLADMVRELNNARHPPTAASPLAAGDPGYDSSIPRYTDLAFSMISRFDYAGKQPVFGDQVRYRWVLEDGETVNGKDDNRNGLVDEGVIEKIETFEGKPAVTTVVCRDVAFKGLRFQPGDHVVTVVLDLQRRDMRNTLVLRKVETTADLRN